jgi:drug/metabolite transporter (DMT)-like permease
MNFYYLLAVLASVGFASQFAAMKLYQKNTDNNLPSSLVLTMFCATITIPFFWALNGFKLSATPLTLIISLGLGVIGVVSTLTSIKILSYGKMSVYSMFMMLGGMALPAVFGVIVFSEQATDFKIIGMIVLVVSLVLSARDKQSEIKSKSIGIFYLLCLLAFTLNGTNSVLSNIQGKGWAEGANNMVWGMEVTDLYDFMVWTRLFTVLLAAITFCIVMFVSKKEVRAQSFVSVKKIFKKQPILAAVLYTTISVCGFVCQQICTPHIDASALYPITTGGTVVLSAIYGRFLYKEKTSWFMWMCIGLTALATVFFMFGGMFPTTWFAGLFS